MNFYLFYQKRGYLYKEVAGMNINHGLNHFALNYKRLMKANQVAFQVLLKIKQKLILVQGALSRIY